jgi:hypothetical protein
MSLVDIEFHRAVVTHFQQQRLAVVLILDVHALHDFESFQRFFLKGNQNLFSISHWSSLLASVTIRVVPIIGNRCVRLTITVSGQSRRFDDMQATPAPPPARFSKEKADHKLLLD